MSSYTASPMEVCNPSGTNPIQGSPLRVGFYEIEGKIGQGNFAVVRLARHRITKTEVRSKISKYCANRTSYKGCNKNHRQDKTGSEQPSQGLQRSRSDEVGEPSKYCQALSSDGDQINALPCL